MSEDFKKWTDANDYLKRYGVADRVSIGNTIPIASAIRSAYNDGFEAGVIDVTTRVFSGCDHSTDDMITLDEVTE